MFGDYRMKILWKLDFTWTDFLIKFRFLEEMVATMNNVLTQSEQQVSYEQFTYTILTTGEL